MPFEMSWYIEKRVINIRFYGDVNVAEVVSTGTTIRQYVAQSTPPLFMIVDARAVTKYPNDLKTMLQGMKNDDDNSTKIKHTVIISDNRLVNFFGTMIAGFFNMPIRSYKTLEEGEAYLAHHAEDLAPLFAARNPNHAPHLTTP